jgi:hypothetical protein
MIEAKPITTSGAGRGPGLDDLVMEDCPDWRVQSNGQTRSCDQCSTVLRGSRNQQP